MMVKLDESSGAGEAVRERFEAVARDAELVGAVEPKLTDDAAGADKQAESNVDPSEDAARQASQSP